MDAGYWMGMEVLKAPEDELPMSFHFEEPYEGEIDIQLHMGLSQPVSLENIEHVASPICITVLTLINLAADEFLVPVAPLQVRSLGENGSAFRNTITMAVRRRPEIVMDMVKAATDRFVCIRAGLGRDEAQAISVAARRYVTSLTETDPIDKYCDLWESCEFATLFVKAKGGKVGRVAEALTSHWNRTSQRPELQKARVERLLEIKQLYEIRGEIVHQALDAPERLAERTHLLEAIAAELLRNCLGLPSSTSGPVFERLSSVTPNEPLDRGSRSEPKRRHSVPVDPELPSN